MAPKSRISMSAVTRRPVSKRMRWMPPSASRAPRNRGGVVVVGGDIVDGVGQNWAVILGILGIALLVYLLGSLRVLRQYERGVVFLLRKFEGVRAPGLTLIFVPIQQMVRVSLRTVTMQIPSQKIITKDNVSIDIAAVAYY